MCLHLGSAGLRNVFKSLARIVLKIRLNRDVPQCDYAHYSIVLYNGHSSNLLFAHQFCNLVYIHFWVAYHRILAHDIADLLLLYILAFRSRPSCNIPVGHDANYLFLIADRNRANIVLLHQLGGSFDGIIRIQLGNFF